jgi:hypothetical protein
MNKNQSATLNSFDLTDLVLDNYSLAWGTSVPFTGIVTKWRLVVADIKTNKIIQETDIKGIRMNKLAKQLSMAGKSFKLVNAVQAYAMDIEDNNLYNMVNYTERDLMKGREENCVSKARIIEAATRTNIAALTPYGVVIAEVDDFKDSIDVFEDSIPAPDNAIIARIDSTRQLKELFKKGRTIIVKSMKKGAAQFKAASPEFYTRLLDSFKINSLPVHHTEMDFNITEKNTGTVLPGVKVTAVPVDGTGDTMTQYSNMTGEADYREISPEMYNVTFELPHHVTTNKIVKAERGKKIELNVEMDRV